jgi:tetratricopeptide (TPR) repeat protein
MTSTFLTGAALAALLILLIGARLALLLAEDRRRLSRAVTMLRTGLLPSKLEEQLVAEGMDRGRAAEVVIAALKALPPAMATATRRSVRAAAPTSASPLPTGPSAPAPGTACAASPPLPDDPHERGVALLFKRRDYPAALEAFTQAIELDPLGPNSYLGRAIVHRRLDNLSAALEDEQKAQELGGAEKSAWDRLVNRSRHRWHWDFDNPDWKQTDPLSRKAVLIRTFTGQIYNGGLAQWVFNGYWRWLDDLIETVREVDMGATREVAMILEELSPDLAAVSPDDARQMILEELSPDLATESPDDAPQQSLAHDEEAASEQEGDGFIERLWEYERRYHLVEGPFADDVTNWFEKKAALQPGQSD